MKWKRQIPLIAEHLLQNGFRYVVKALQGRIDYPVPIFVGHHDKQAICRNPRIVDQNFDVFKPGEDILKASLRCGGIAYVKPGFFTVASRLPDHLQGFFCRLVVRFIIQNNIIAGTGQLHGDRRPIPLAPPVTIATF